MKEAKVSRSKCHCSCSFTKQPSILIVLNTLEETQERHDTLKEIEKKLLDLHQIYLDMAVLDVQSGTTQLQNTKKLQKNFRKWKYIPIMIFLIIAVVIVLGVIKPWKSS